MSESEKELKLLQDVYQSARKLLRYQGSNRSKYLEATEELETATFIMSLFDQGLLEWQDE